MITIIAGSRSLGSRELKDALSKYKLPITGVGCGCASGIDKAGYEWARSRNIPVLFFPAWAHHFTWAFFNKKPGEIIDYPKGGYIGNTLTYGTQRNKRMAEYLESEAVLLVWDGKSRGTVNMKREAESAGMIVTQYEYT